MKSVKLNKKMLRDGVALLEGAGAVRGKQGFPSDVFMSPQDYKVLRNNVKTSFKRENPGLSKAKLELAVGMHLLNYGPVECKAIRPGHILVDLAAIQASDVSES